jgi:APA family basic amino acid/polyamine antiporter
MKLIHFKKKLGLPGAVSVAVGAVIGVGIFVIVGPIGAVTGAWMPLAFAAAAVPAILGAIVAMALGGVMPSDGGGFFYTRNLLGRTAGALTSSLIIGGALGAVAAVSVGVSDYLRLSYFPGIPRAIPAVSLICLAWAINSIGIMTSEKVQIGMITFLLSALLAVVFTGIGKGVSPDFSAPLPAGAGGFAQGCVTAMLTYIGFNMMGELGEEVENPRRNIPLTIALGLAVVMFIYIGVGWLVAGTLSVGEMKATKVALLDSAVRHIGSPWFKHYLNLAALFAGLASVNAAFLAVPRELCALSENGIVPKAFMKFNPGRQTFPVGIAFTAACGCALAAPALEPDKYGLIAVAGLMLANAMLSLAALRLEKLHPEKVATAPIRIRRAWLLPSGVLSAILSLVFGVLAVTFFPPVLAVLALFAGAGLVLSFLRKEGGT